MMEQTIWIGLENGQNDIIVKVDGKPVGKAKDVIKSLAEAYAQLTIPATSDDPEWLTAIRGI